MVRRMSRFFTQTSKVLLPGAGAESVPVLGGGNPEATHKRQTKVLTRLETTLPGDGFQRQIRFFKALDCCFETNAFEKMGRSGPGLAFEHASKIAEAHGRVFGENFITQIAVKILTHPMNGLCQHAAILELGQQGSAELGLPAGALEIQYQQAGNVQRHRTAMVFLQQRQRQVDPSRDTRRGVDRTVLDMEGITLDINLRVLLSKLIDQKPMGCRAPTFKQPCPRKDEGTGTYRSDPARQGSCVA
jgi:hypothetical protein